MEYVNKYIIVIYYASLMPFLFYATYAHTMITFFKKWLPSARHKTHPTLPHHLSGYRARNQRPVSRTTRIAFVLEARTIL